MIRAAVVTVGVLAAVIFELCSRYSPITATLRTR